jgi:hypothetical protein
MEVPMKKMICCRIRAGLGVILSLVLLPVCPAFGEEGDVRAEIA